MHNFGGGRSDYLIQGGGGQKGGGGWGWGGGIFSKFRGELAKRGILKNQVGFGP